LHVFGLDISKEEKNGLNSMNELEWQIHNRLASEHSKNAVFLWVITGILVFIFKGELFSWQALLFFTIGLFVASFLSIPTYTLKRWLAKRLVKEEVPEFLIPIYWILDLAYIPIIAFLIINWIT
jgi:hypothetical protein